MKTLLILLLVGIVAARKSYKEYVLMDVTPSNREQGFFLHKQMIEDVELDFWDEKIAAGNPTRILLHSSHVGDFSRRLAEHGIDHEVVDINIQSTLDIELREMEERRANREKAFDIDDFNTLTDINLWLAQQYNDCAGIGLTCTWSSLGQSIEGRDINLFTITANPDATDVIYMDSATHSREWLTPATLLKFVDNFMRLYGNDTITPWLENYRWDFVAVVNPDGYEFTFSDDRLWRKNRVNNAGSACIGVDLNRNHDFRWGSNGVSPLPCSDIYMGPSGSSELETQAVESYLNSTAANCFTMITLHAYGYDWMHPWGNTIEEGNDGAPCDIAEDHDDMFAGAEAAGLAAQKSNGDPWEWGNSCVVIYTTTGATDDWSKGVAGIKYSYNPELRGNTFVVPKEDIEVSYKEVKAAMTALINYLATAP